MAIPEEKDINLLDIFSNLIERLIAKQNYYEIKDIFICTSVT